MNERELHTHTQLEETLQKLQEHKEVLEVLINNRLDKQEGEEMQTIKQAMLKLRETKKELKTTNEKLNKFIEDMLL